MATTINDALTAIDDYMAKNGKGQSYLAKKFIDLFESKDSPLNVVDGPMKLIADKFQKLGKKVDDLELSFGSFNKKVRILMAAIKPSTFNKLNTAAEDLTKRLNNYVLKFPKMGSGTRNRTPTIPKTLLDNIHKIRTNTNGLGLMGKILVNIERLLRESTKERSLRDTSTQPHQISKRTVVNLFSNNSNNSGNSRGDDNKSGIFGKMFKFAMLGTGVYLLGKFKKYLDDTSTGRAIQSILSGTFASILGSITDFVKSKETWETFGNAALFLIDGISAIADNIFKYVVEPIAEKVKTTDWGQVAKKMWKNMTWVWDNLISPVFNSIGESMKKDFKNGDYTSLATKAGGTLGILAIMSKLPIVGSILKVVLWSVITPIKLIGRGIVAGTRGIFGLLTKVPATTWMAVGRGFITLAPIIGMLALELTAVVAAVALVGYSLHRMKNVYDTMAESAEIAAKNSKTMGTAIQKQLDAHTKNIENIKKEKDGPQKDENLRVEGLRAQLSNINKKREHVVISNNGILGQIDSMLMGRNSIYEAKMRGLYKEEQEIRKQLNILPAATHVQDAEIIIPDKKDAHIFAKGGGPFDQALKDVNKKIDVIVAVLSDGFSGLAAVTAQSGGNVAQAVIASAGASKQTPPTIIGGSNPIQRHRINTGRHIEFGQ